MLIVEKRHFYQGLLLIGSFLVVFFMIFMPLFPGGQNGLEYADNLFNRLSKGSSYFIPAVSEQVETVKGIEVTVPITLKSPEMTENVVSVLTRSGVNVTRQGEELVVSGNLADLLEDAVVASDAMYDNNAERVAQSFGMDAKEAMRAWHAALNAMIKPMQREDMVREANVVNMVVLKAIEPGFNFYGIQAESVSSKLWTLIGLLVFYVLYTLWYGFAIFDLFDGMGLSMKKSKVRKEV